MQDVKPTKPTTQTRTKNLSITVFTVIEMNILNKGLKFNPIITNTKQSEGVNTAITIRNITNTYDNKFATKSSATANHGPNNLGTPRSVEQQSTSYLQK